MPLVSITNKSNRVPTATIRIGSRVTSFTLDGGASLLDQGLSQGLSLNYSCKRGDCGQCAATLVTGAIEPVNRQRPCVQGQEVLLCNAAATSDVELRLPYFPELDGIRVLRTPAKVHELRTLDHDVREIVLRLPPATDFRFLPGQYIRLTTPGRITRSYSLVDGPVESRHLRIHVRRVEEGAFSTWAFSQARVGELLYAEGPLGHFFLSRERRVARTLLLATGTGIAPVHAMLSSLTQEQKQRCGEISVYWGNRHRADAYLSNDLAALAARQRFGYFPVFSREPEPSEHRHVQDLMLRQHPRLADAQVFAAGSTAMVEDARQRCRQAGLPDDSFHADPFTAS